MVSCWGKEKAETRGQLRWTMSLRETSSSSDNSSAHVGAETGAHIVMMVGTTPCAQLLNYMCTSCLLLDSNHQVRILKTEAGRGREGFTQPFCSPSQKTALNTSPFSALRDYLPVSLACGGRRLSLASCDGCHFLTLTLTLSVPWTHRLKRVSPGLMPRVLLGQPTWLALPEIWSVSPSQITTPLFLGISR